MSHAIVKSRIWRTLVTIGGWLLRLRRSQTPTAGAPVVALSDPAVQPASLRDGTLSTSPYALRKDIRDWATELRGAAGLLSLTKDASRQPFFTIVTPTWNTKQSWFAQAALSVLRQTADDWEWCIVDDASSQTEFHAFLDEFTDTDRFRIRRRTQRGGISAATNDGLHMARGQWVCFLDHDDELAPDALDQLRNALESGFDAVYSDSDKVDEAGAPSEPFHKPDWSPEYLRGVMYVGHLLCVRRDLALEAGGFDSDFDGVQDYEFFLRYTERTRKIGHVPRILYHWRVTPGSVAASTQAKPRIWELQKAAVQAHVDRLGLKATAEFGPSPHRIRLSPVKSANTPRVSVIIPTRDAPEMIGRCLDSLVGLTSYPNFEIVCVDNDTRDPEALRILAEAPVKQLLFPGKFNFSVASNLGALHAEGAYLVFMNNDIEARSADWIEQMLFYAEREDVGAVGALLLYPNGTVQHAGVVLGCRGTADHVLRGFSGASDGYAGSLCCAREVSAVTAACMMIKKELFESLGRFNEHFYTAYQDVDLCMRIRAAGRRIIFTPQATFIHHESYSRGKVYDHIDRNLLLDLWQPVIDKGDPYYSLHFDLEKLDHSLKPAATLAVTA
ncbi:MAG: glycosyltransferase family 2 protein [Acidobacteriia bacterium]|nr:glycosyltransferase family 2 protein [Terriglobia bacterium]